MLYKIQRTWFSISTFDTVHGDEIELILKQLSESDFTLQCEQKQKAPANSSEQKQKSPEKAPAEKTQSAIQLKPKIQSAT